MSLPLRYQIINHARSWIGTPFHHQGRLKGKGVDCLGMVIGIAGELNLRHGGKELAKLDNIHYSQTPNVMELLEKLKDNLTIVPFEDMQIGDLALVNVVGSPQHLAVIGDYVHGGFSVIHAVLGKGVVEQRLDLHWSRRIVKIYRFEG